MAGRRIAPGPADDAPSPESVPALDDERALNALTGPLEDTARLYGVVGWSPAGRPARRARRAAHQREVAHRRQLAVARRSAQEALRQQRRAEPYLPAAGERGAMAGRSYRRLRVVPHRATSEMLAGAYPFLAEEGLGAGGILIGQDAWSGAAFCYDPFELYRRGVLTNPNIFLAGQIGRGKSTLAKSLATRCVAFGRRVYVPGDPKGEWTVVARALGGQAVQLGIGSTARLNPLDEGPRPPAEDDSSWRQKVAARRLGLLGALAEATLGRRLFATERSALDAALDATTASCAVPLLPAVVEAMLDPQRPAAGSTVAQLCEDGREAVLPDAFVDHADDIRRDRVAGARPNDQR